MLFLPVVSSAASVFAETPQQLPPFLPTWLEANKTVLVSHKTPSEREKGWGWEVGWGSRVTAQNRLSTVGPEWLSRGEGLAPGPPNPEDDKWHLKETVKHNYCIKSSVKVNYKIYGGLIEWVSGE